MVGFEISAKEHQCGLQSLKTLTLQCYCKVDMSDSTSVSIPVCMKSFAKFKVINLH